VAELVLEAGEPEPMDGRGTRKRRLSHAALVVALSTAPLLRGHEAFDSLEVSILPRHGWRLCAPEGGSCKCVGTVALHSVLADWAMLRHVNGSIACGVPFFGDDPRPGLPKLCSCLRGPAWPEALVDGLNETISRKLLPRVEAGPPDASCSAEDDGSWTPCSVLSSRYDASFVPDRILPRLPVDEQRDMALRKLDLCHRLVGPDQALRILGVWPTNIQMGVVPIKASSAPLCAVVYSPSRGAFWDNRAAIFCPTEPPKCLEGSCECADSSLRRVDLRERDGTKDAAPCWTCLPSSERKGEAPSMDGRSALPRTASDATPMGARSQVPSSLGAPR